MEKIICNICGRKKGTWKIISGWEFNHSFGGKGTHTCPECVKKNTEGNDLLKCKIKAPNIRKRIFGVL